MAVVFSKANDEIMKNAIISMRNSHRYDPIANKKIPEKCEPDENQAIHNFVDRHQKTSCNVQLIKDTWSNLCKDFKEFLITKLGTNLVNEFKERKIDCFITGIYIQNHSPNSNTLLVQDTCGWKILLHEVLHTIIKERSEKEIPKVETQIDNLIEEFKPIAKSLQNKN